MMNSPSLIDLFSLIFLVLFQIFDCAQDNRFFKFYNIYVHMNVNKFIFNN